MKVLSVLQPWATLIVIGAKKIETRSTNTKHRGPLLIHASKRQTTEGHALWHSKWCWNKMPVAAVHFAELPFGAIIGQVNLIHTCDTPTLEERLLEKMNIFQSEFLWPNKPDQELEFGNYEKGRFGWLLSDAQRFKETIPTKGQLGLWNYELQNLSL